MLVWSDSEQQQQQQQLEQQLHWKQPTAAGQPGLD